MEMVEEITGVIEEAIVEIKEDTEEEETLAEVMEGAITIKGTEVEEDTWDHPQGWERTTIIKLVPSEA
jgi:hypothetical protein